MIREITAFIISVFISNLLIASPQIYLFLGGGPAKENWKLLDNPQIAGAQIIYSWKRLEPKKNHYDFDIILQDLSFLTKHGKKLFIQIQDRSFTINNIPIPDYLLTKEYNGGIAKQLDFPGEGKPIGTGWVAKQWNPDVQHRFEKLLIALGQKLDGKIAGINLPETAIDIDIKKQKSFSCKKYFNSILKNILALKKSFKKSSVVQYVNFFPCEWNNDHKYMSTLFKYAIKNKIGLGNPDTVPNNKNQMHNSYPFFNKNKNKIELIAIAVQEPDYTYTNPKTNKKYTSKELYDFDKEYIGADVIFWNTQEPKFSKRLIPFLKERNQ